MKHTHKKPWALSALILLCAVLATSCIPPYYMKMNPPADSDKPLPVPAGDNSCWLHTAANMLAGAGYGNGNTLQDRADDIWNDMDAHYRLANGDFDGGWIDSALQWWLGSANNVWPNNLYRVVTVYGNKIPKDPWANPNGAMDIGNHLRACNFVGVSISYPVAGPTVGAGGHAITAWGDSDNNHETLTSNPSGIRVADSDRDTGGDVQAYTYDAYNNPNPGGANEGNGWYFDYKANHYYIKHITTLTPAQVILDVNSVRATGSYQILQISERAAANLYYQASTDADRFTYSTTVDQPGVPTITEADP